jgi:hypothetical protein
MKQMSRGEKIGVAAGLGVLSFFLLFFLGEGVKIPESIQGAESSHAAIFILALGGYFLVAQYLLSSGNPDALRKDWLIIASLNSVLSLSAVIALLIEPNKLAAFQTLGIAVFAWVSSCAGAVLAARKARRSVA